MTSSERNPTLNPALDFEDNTLMAGGDTMNEGFLFDPRYHDPNYKQTQAEHDEEDEIFRIATEQITQEFGIPDGQAQAKDMPSTSTDEHMQSKRPEHDSKRAIQKSGLEPTGTTLTNGFEKNSALHPPPIQPPPPPHTEKRTFEVDEEILIPSTHHSSQHQGLMARSNHPIARVLRNDWTKRFLGAVLGLLISLAWQWVRHGWRPWFWVRTPEEQARWCESTGLERLMG